MLFLLASLAVLAPARADSITLDSGATIEGDLARYEFGGDCQLSVTEGPLTGVIVIVPCHRVQSFMRTSVRTPVAIGLEEEAVSTAEELDTLPIVAGDSASGGIPVQASAELASAAPEAPLAAPVVAPAAATPAPHGETRTETRAVSFGQGAGAVEVDEEPFYDEPLFPRDPDEPIGVATSEPPVSSRPAASVSASSGSSAPAGATADGASQRSAAPAPIEPTGPRMAPRMDEPTPPSDRRSVNF